MKKKILKLCAAVLAALSLFGCAEITEGGGNITSFDCPELSGDELVMLPGETSEGWVSPNMRDLDLFSPDDVVFVSEDENVAQIELEEVRADIFLCYKVTAVSVGETYVYAMTTDGSVLTPKQKVMVDSGDEPETAEPLETVPPKFAIVRRNAWMIDKSDLLIACVKYSWGGAAKTLEYAKRKRIKILYI